MSDLTWSPHETLQLLSTDFSESLSKTPANDVLPSLALLLGDDGTSGGKKASSNLLFSTDVDIRDPIPKDGATEKSATLSSPSLQREVSVISYHWACASLFTGVELRGAPDDTDTEDECEVLEELLTRDDVEVLPLHDEDCL